MEAQEDNRVWMYRKGKDGQTESQMFGHPSAVPEGEGWVDSPAKAAEAPKKPRKAKAEPPPEPDEESDE